MPFQQAALKGHNIPAQVKALGTGPPVEEALKGRNIELLKFCASQSKPKICNALSGLKTLWHLIPRALLWAGMFPEFNIPLKRCRKSLFDKKSVADLGVLMWKSRKTASISNRRKKSKNP